MAGIYRCTNIGNCSKADSQERIQLSAVDSPTCPECSSLLMDVSPKQLTKMLPYLLAASGILMLGGIGVWFLTTESNLPDNRSDLSAELEKERQSRQDAERRALEAEWQARLEAERQSRQDAERRVLEGEQQAKQEAERQSRQDAERRTLELEQQAKQEAERQARQKAERQLAAERQARLEAERQLKVERRTSLEAEDMAEVHRRQAVQESAQPGIVASRPAFPPGTPNTRVRERLGEPTRITSGLWNTIAWIYDDMALSYLIDRQNGRIRQSEIVFPITAQFEEITNALSAMTNINSVPIETKRQIRTVYDGQQERVRFSLGIFHAQIERQEGERFYLGIWDKNLKQ